MARTEFDKASDLRVIKLVIVVWNAQASAQGNNSLMVKHVQVAQVGNHVLSQNDRVLVYEMHNSEYQ